MLFLQAHIVDQRRSYRVGFSAEQQAVKFVQARRGTHSFEVEKPAEWPEGWDALAELLWPTCEHGMSLASCFGSQHFMSLDQEMAMDWQYAD